jgi:ABC-type nitrate/sulfonate/bicarbonate transport system permease component
VTATVSRYEKDGQHFHLATCGGAGDGHAGGSVAPDRVASGARAGGGAFDGNRCPAYGSGRTYVRSPNAKAGAVTSLTETPAVEAAEPAERRPAVPGWVLGLAGFTVFLLLLEVVPVVGLVPRKWLPALHSIVSAGAREVVTGAFWTAVGQTLRGWALSLLIAFAAGVVLGVLIGSLPWLRSLTASTIEFLRPIPSVALIPLAVLQFGNRLGSTLLLAVYASFWQVLVQVLSGVRDVDPVARDTAAAFRLRPADRIRYVTWPTALPYALTGLRLAAAVALILTVTAELIIGAPGLGDEIGLAQTGGAVPLMYALVFVTGLIGVAVNLGARGLERVLLPWHPSRREEIR